MDQEPALNRPYGGDGLDEDGYIRALSGFVAQLRDRVTALELQVELLKNNTVANKQR